MRPAPGWGCSANLPVPLRPMLASAGEHPLPRIRTGHHPALLSLLSQGLCLCQHHLPVCADRLPLSLHCAEKAASGDMGRWGGPPCFGTWHRVFLWQAEGLVGALLVELYPQPASVSLQGPLPFAPPFRTPTPKSRGPSILCVTVQSPAGDRPRELPTVSWTSGWRLE